MPTQHAILAPSASKRWMTCAPSARMEQAYPEKNTAYSIEGTLAHSCAETMLGIYTGLKHTLTLDEFWNYCSDIDANDEGFAEIRQECRNNGIDFGEMSQIIHDNYVIPVFEDFLEYRRADRNSVLMVEAPLNLRSFIPEGFGSSDAVIISGETLRVYDLKYGKGVKVDAFENPQMMCYALGALYGPADTYAIENVVMTIIQPRLEHYSSYSMKWGELVEWGKHVLRPAAQRAFEGKGEYVPGDHCRFCKASMRCRANWLRAKVVSESAEDPAQLSDDELAYVLGQIESIKAWADKMTEQATAMVAGGHPIPGWKLVEGRSVRKISDQDAAIEALHESGFTDDVILKPRELRTITDLQKALTKKGFETVVGRFVVKPQGKPTLVPESDSRPAMADAQSDFKDIVC